MTDDDRDADWRDAARTLPPGAALIVRARDPVRREALARTLRPIAQRGGICLLIADDLRLAIRIRADGVHLPGARALFGASIRRSWRHMLITIAAHSVAGLRRAAMGRADAALLSGAFASGSHPGRAVSGLSNWGLAKVQAASPVIALGGIDAANASRLIAMRADGIALISAWFGPSERAAS